MDRDAQQFEPLQIPASADAGNQIWLEVADLGADSGIDIRVCDPFVGQLCFEIFALHPESCPLVGKAPQSDTTFRAFLKTLGRAENIRRISIFIRFHHCRSNLRRSARWCDERNSRVYRMVEDIADEITTHRPGSRIDIAMQRIGRANISLM